MSKIGVSEVPKKKKEYFENEVHHFIVAIGGGSTEAGSVDNQLWTASIPILGYIDLDTGKKSAVKSSMQFVLTDEEQVSRNYFTYFEADTICKIKGLLPKALGDKQADNSYRMSGLYVTEIISNHEKNDFLQELIDEYHQPVTITSEVFGEMMLDKELGWYEGTGDWLGEKVAVSMTAPDEEDETIHNLRILEQFFRNQAEWDKKLREYASAELTELANDWADDAVEDEEEPQEITQSDFAHRITIDSIVFEENGEFIVYFNDDDMFWGHSVTVYGDVENGLNDAQIEG